MPIDPFSYENLADGEGVAFFVFFVRFDEKNQNRKLDKDKPETDFQLIDTFSYENLADGEL